MAAWIGPAISAGASLLGGLFGQKQQDKNVQLQKEFAQSGIQWRVADAKKAGIHPLYALGAPTVQPSVSAFSPMGAAVSSMGQDISRAVTATQNGSERNNAMNQQLAALTLQRAGLENELLATRIAKLKGGQIGPPIPTDSPEPFNVPEDPKPEQRPPLMYGGSRWQTNPNTSPMDAWVKQYGEEGAISKIMPLMIMWQDLKANYGEPGDWPTHWWNRFNRELDQLGIPSGPATSRRQLREGRPLR